MAAAAPAPAPAPGPPPADAATFRRLYPEEVRGDSVDEHARGVEVGKGGANSTRENERKKATAGAAPNLATDSHLHPSPSNQFLARHLAARTRPCGRGLTEARPLTISLDVAAPPSARAPTPTPTAIARAGGTTALAGVRLEVAPPPPAGGAAGGALVVSVEVPPIACGERGGGDRLAGLAGAVRAGLEGCVDGGALLIPSSSSSSSSPAAAAAAIFVARLDIVLLSADGGELGVALAAAAAALAATAVPGVVVTGGRVVPVAPGGGGGEAAALNAATAAATAAPPGADPASRIAGLLTTLPVALTAGLWRGGAAVLVDPDAEEEASLDGLVSAVVGLGGGGGSPPAADAPLLHAVFGGGPALAPPGLIVSTARGARARGEEVRRALVAALEGR